MESKERRGVDDGYRTIATSKARPSVSLTNVRIIRSAMRERGVTGDDRDYVVFVADEILTSFSTYRTTSRLDDRPVDVTNVEGDGEIGVGKILLVHRSKLYRHLAKSELRKFWRFGRRTRR